MAEELFFLKIDSQLARVNMVNTLQDDNFSYQAYVAENFAKDELTDFDTILNLVSDDIEMLSEDEFWSLRLWLYHQTDALHPDLAYGEFSKIFQEEMKFLGMEQFHEIPSKTPVRIFHEILDDYERIFQKDLPFKCFAETLDDFLNYAICFTGELRIFLEEHFYKQDAGGDVRQEIERVNAAHGNQYHEQALVELEKSHAYRLETIRLLTQLSEFRKNNSHLTEIVYPPDFNEMIDRESHLLNLADNYWHHLELKRKIAGYQGLILRLHSY